MSVIVLSLALLVWVEVVILRVCYTGQSQYQSKHPLLSLVINKALDLLNHAAKPVFLIGGGVNIARANREMTQLAELTGVPVITTIMGKGAVPTTNSLYVGNIGIHGSYAANSAVSNCDVLFSIGTRFNDRITGKTEEFAANAKIVHIDVDAASISRNIDVDIPIVADAKKAICALLEKAKPLHISAWTDEINRWKKEYPITMGKVGLTPQTIIQSINELFKDAIVTIRTLIPIGVLAPWI